MAGMPSYARGAATGSPTTTRTQQAPSPHASARRPCSWLARGCPHIAARRPPSPRSHLRVVGRPLGIFAPRTTATRRPHGTRRLIRGGTHAS